jgi:hypothetical protein
LLQHLKVVDDSRVDILLQSVQLQLREVASKRTNLFRDCLSREDLEEAETHLSSLRAMGEAFDAEEDLGLDLGKLEASYVAEQQSKTLQEKLDVAAYAEAGSCWQALQDLKTSGNVHVDRPLKSAQRRLREVASNRANLLMACLSREDLEEAETHLSSLRAMGEAFDAEEDLGLDLGKLEASYVAEQQSKTLQEKLDVAAYAEAGSCWQALQDLKTSGNVDVDRPLKSSQRRIREVASNRTNLFRECLLREALKEAETHLSSLRAMSEAFDAEEDLRLDLDKLEASYDVLFQKEQEKLLRAQLLSMAFGAKEWEKYFGEVDTALPPPPDIDKILESPCPFWPGKQVKDTHLLVLIPKEVDGRAFNLNLLEELIQHPKGGGHATKYEFYGSDTKEQFGTQSPRASYWVLMTRDVLEGSRNKTYKDQKALIAAHAPYALPGALEAATAILLHYVRGKERLYADKPWTYTRCQELEDNKYPVVVGGFSSGGLHVPYDYNDYCDDFGVSCLRKF